MVSDFSPTIEILKLLQQLREDLVYSHISLSNDIVEPIFKYEQNIVAMNISIDLFYMLWIDKHFESFNSKNLNLNSAAMNLFSKIMLKMVDDFNQEIAKSSKSCDLFFKLLGEKRKILTEMLVADTMHDKNIIALSISHHKSRALFSRMLNNMEKE